jgi:B12-binding domain/radical SAM domain protein
LPIPDLILLHAPSVYDFRENFAVYGPISDVIPSTPIFEMYPLGFVSMVAYLEDHGYRARIINLAVKMLKDPSFNVETFIKKIEAKAFGFDLHWLAHSNGSLRLAEIVKKYHPNSPILVGGLSSTYYHEEIINEYPQIDYILRGDSTEKPLLELIKNIELNKQPENVPNLTWRDQNQRKRINPLTYVPDNLDELTLDYEVVVKLVLRHRDLESNLPYESFLDYPFTAVLTCKGCTHNCTTCGGSRFSFSNFFGREVPAFKSPEKLVEEMRIICEYFKTPIFLLGDINQAGQKYVDSVLENIKNADIDNIVMFELFDPVQEDSIKKISKSCDSFSMEISPDSHDEDIRRFQGRYYSNDSMEKTIENALKYGAKKFDVFYMSGLPGQTRESVLDSVEYASKLMIKFGQEKRIYTFVAPMAPFLDPGSLAFEYPKKYGFTRLYNTLAEHREAMLKPTWKHVLNYYTDWMSKDDIAQSTYEGMLQLNKVKIDLGIVDIERGKIIASGLTKTMDLIKRIDEIIASTNDDYERSKLINMLKNSDETIARSRTYLKRELRVPGGAGLKTSGIVKSVFNYIRQKFSY